MCLAVGIFMFGMQSASALSWTGSSTGGGGEGGAAKTKGFAIRYTNDNNCLGYRFSVVDKNGNTKNGASLDVFRNTTYGNSEYSAAYKFTVKYNKKQLIANQNNNFSTAKTTSGCVKETTMGFAAALPVPSGMNAWQSNHNNLNKVLFNLGINGVGALTNGDKVLVEPLQDVRLETIYHSVTVTELAIYGKWLLGANSNGGSSPDSGKWGFISNYTNKFFPNALYTPDGKGLWAGVGALSSRATFYNIINKGYGVGIAYTETKPDFSPTLSVNVCEAWRGSRSSRSFRYGTSNGSAFGNYSYANGYPVMGDSVWFAVNFPGESQTTRVRQYVRLRGGNWTTRDVNLSGSTWYDVSLSPTTVDAGRSSYIVEAKQDWIDGSGRVLKSGAVKTFYFPIKPKVNRDTVTMYDIQGDVAARKSTGISSTMSLYAGQRVRPYYSYSANTSWVSSNNFMATLYKWSGGKWTAAYSGGSDLYAGSLGIKSGSPVARYSSLGLYTVPEYSAAANRLRVELKTQWTSDPSRTTETTAFEISILKPDVELVSMRLVDEDGYYFTGTKLVAGKKYMPQYTVRNNTGCKVYVYGYDANKNRIGAFGVPANGTVTFNGYTVTIPNQSSYSFWGGVYLDSVPIYDTHYETNGSNNAKTTTYQVVPPIAVEPVVPNASYRAGTEVMTSFLAVNNTGANVLPARNVSLRFTATSNGSTIYTQTKTSVVIPSGGSNLVYFKWNVPLSAAGANVVLKGEIFLNGLLTDSKTIQNRVMTTTASQTPDTVFEKTAPSGFRIVPPPVRSVQTTANWSEWNYTNGTFMKKNYGITLQPGRLELTPDENSPSRAYKNGLWHMKSGYGYSLEWFLSYGAAPGREMHLSAYTPIQTGFLYVPEFQYGQQTGQFRTLKKNWTFSFILPQNPSAENKALHFIPLWFPDGNYIAQVYASDMWTPAGMLSSYMNSVPLVISESAYDDWYVGK